MKNVAPLIVFGLLPLFAAQAATPNSDNREQTLPTGSSAELAGFINQRIQQGWQDNEVSPSAVAADAEWVRRVYLDIVGHIPPAEKVESFLADKQSDKRSRLIDELLDDPGYVRNMTTIWANLMIGRRTPRRVSRTGMTNYLQEVFSSNRPWDRVVEEIVTAEGHFEKNGAVNYLLAQMQNRDDAVQATAKTTRLFLGIQVQCTQCHNHPFNDWKQSQFWEYNSFFRQVRRVNHRKFDPVRNRQVDDYSELVRTDYAGPVYYEKRSGLMQVAYPKYLGQKVDDGYDTDRRAEFGKLIVQGEKPLIAQAMVNRTWGRFFGYGFTRPVDDMGPHNPPTHPELLDRLTVEFVKSGYDVKQLIRWICNSDAYQLTSHVNEENAIDNPSAGEIPLFSHMYVKSLEAEQLYDSLIIATKAHRSGQANWEGAEQQRERWMQQFIIAFDTDENDEATTFNGTIPQALMMMNGQLIQRAVSIESGSYLSRLLRQPIGEGEKIRKLYLATLSRQPERRELSAALKLIRANRSPIVGYQDLFWALLNSNEFIVNH